MSEKTITHTHFEDSLLFYTLELVSIKIKFPILLIGNYLEKRLFSINKIIIETT